MVSVTLPDGRKASIPALPLEIGGQRLTLRRDIPQVGEHTREIAAELGYDAATIDRLVVAGVLTTDNPGGAARTDAPV
jgi:crotonobetainyl-CoA:carnitine CoA-transferase CaiB-like acyl-CoA transferase